MSAGEILTRATIGIALAGYAAGAVVYALSCNRKKWDETARLAWTVACIGLLAHVICAFHFYHEWSHASAYRDTARQTAEVFGLEWGGGLYINYAFLLGWVIDTLWWWRGLEAHRSRPWPLVLAWRAFLLFIFFNGTIGPIAFPFYYGWVNLAIAAMAMVGTLPGRTQGLGLITEPLLADLQIDRILFARINFGATLIGSLFCFGIGRMIDRFGSRAVLTIVVTALAAVVVLMSGAQGIAVLAVLITLTRGLGQSALSVISITMVGQWFVARLNAAMGVYTIALSLGFMLAFPIVGATALDYGWRTAWTGIGLALLFGLAPLAWLLVRRTPEACGLALDGERVTESPSANDAAGHTLLQALSTPAFWIFGLASAVYGLIASGIGLFNESILAERGFEASTYHGTLVIGALTALVGNFLGGWLASKWSMNRLMGLAMALLAGSLFALPHVKTQAQVAAYAVVMGLAGGFVIVIFFSFWSRAYGRAHLGKIQGVAQALTVLASAIGPLLLAECVTRTGSYAAMFYILAAIVAALGLGAWLVAVPRAPETPSLAGAEEM
jgi:MFS family permease